jgi:type IX secretion system substrate protein
MSNSLRRISMKQIFHLLLILVNTFIYAGIIHVPEDYSTIQAAIDNGQASDTVLISPGDYYETILIDHSINIIGTDLDSTFIRGITDLDPAISVTSNNIRISNLNIHSADGWNNPTGYVTYSGQCAISITNSANIDLRNIKIETGYGGMAMYAGGDGGTGINILNSDSIFTADLQIQTGSGGGGYYAGMGNGGNGIIISSSNYITIMDINVISGDGGRGGKGIHISGCDSVIIDSSSLNGGFGRYYGASGLLSQNNTQILIYNSTFTGGNSEQQAGHGILLNDHSTANIYNSILNAGNSSGTGGNGLTLTNYSHAELRHSVLIAGTGLNNGNQCYCDATSTIIGFVGIDDRNIDNILRSPILYQNYPNPFNSKTTLEFSLSRSEYVELNIYNIQGELLTNLLSNNLLLGNYKYVWDASNFPSGVYMYCLETGSGFIQTKKIILLK